MSVKGEVPLYDTLSNDYDRFVNWKNRLAYEMPFIERTLREVSARRVIDVACGTGIHAIELARRGYEVIGTDLSVPMIERARENAAAAGVKVPFIVAGFGELAGLVGGPFDAVLCLGNSLPHVLRAKDLGDALADFAAVLCPGGLLLIQNRNFDVVLARRERWMEPQTYREGEVEWLFLRFYDFEADNTLTFNLVTLRREGTNQWSQQAVATRLRPLRQDELTAALAAAGFVDLCCYGDMAGAPFDPETSENLIVTAQRE